MVEKRNSNRGLKVTALAVATFLVAAVIWRFIVILGEGSVRGERVPAAVEVAAIERGTIELKRSFSGSLEAAAAFNLSPKVTGLVKEIAVDIGDPIHRGQIVARLDDAEYVQEVNQAEADLSVAQANLTQAESLLEVAQRELDRIQTLQNRGIASDAQFDTAKIAFAEANAERAIATAQTRRAESALESAKIRLDYTVVSVDWIEGDDERIVAERFIDPGQALTANSPLLRVVELTPITGVFFVTERDYSSLSVGQTVTLTTDAFPQETFEGSINRIAPVFQETSRQARVEISIPNTDRRLKPGMFIRVEAKLDEAVDTPIVPFSAITRRADAPGVFIVNEKEKTVRWQTVETGIRAGERVQLVNFPYTEGRVVTLGQQLIDDGSRITIPADNQPSNAESPAQ